MITFFKDAVYCLSRTLLLTTRWSVFGIRTRTCSPCSTTSWGTPTTGTSRIGTLPDALIMDALLHAVFSFPFNGWVRLNETIFAFHNMKSSCQNHTVDCLTIKVSKHIEAYLKNLAEKKIWLFVPWLLIFVLSRGLDPGGLAKMKRSYEVFTESQLKALLDFFFLLRKISCLTGATVKHYDT